VSYVEAEKLATDITRAHQYWQVGSSQHWWWIWKQSSGSVPSQWRWLA